jgi:hypothetical protein
MHMYSVMDITVTYYWMMDGLQDSGNILQFIMSYKLSSYKKTPHDLLPIGEMVATGCFFR